MRSPHRFSFLQDLQQMRRRLQGGHRRPQAVIARFGPDIGAIRGIPAYQGMALTRPNAVPP